MIMIDCSNSKRLLKTTVFVFFSLFQLQELQKKEGERKQLIEQAIVLAQKVVGNKISKQQYVDNNQNNRIKRDRITEEMESIVASL